MGMIIYASQKSMHHGDVREPSNEFPNICFWEELKHCENSDRVTLVFVCILIDFKFTTILTTDSPGGAQIQLACKLNKPLLTNVLNKISMHFKRFAKFL